MRTKSRRHGGKRKGSGRPSKPKEPKVLHSVKCDCGKVFSGFGLAPENNLATHSQSHKQVTAKSEEVFKCEICKQPVVGRTNWERHVNSKDHVRKQNEQETARKKSEFKILCGERWEYGKEFSVEGEVSVCVGCKKPFELGEFLITPFENDLLEPSDSKRFENIFHEDCFKIFRSGLATEKRSELQRDFESNRARLEGEAI